ncbi:MAG: hypothetical protein KF861_07070 [Planctomycetaceae bacterium]|nr:hypothetical protein [Planctomycetaceae bacterium]
MPRPKRQRVRQLTAAISRYLRECDGDRNRAIRNLRFFGPRFASSWTLKDLRELQDEFDPDGGVCSWLRRGIAAREGEP